MSFYCVFLSFLTPQVSFYDVLLTFPCTSFYDGFVHVEVKKYSILCVFFISETRNVILRCVSSRHNREV